MCIIQHFEEIYPNGHRQPNTHLRYCEHGGPARPCNDARHEVVDNVFRSLPPAPLPPPAFVEVIEPRRTQRNQRERSREEETHRLRRFSNNLKLVFTFGNPFKMSNKKKEYTIVERGGKKHLERRSSHRRRVSPRPTPPPSPRYDDPHIVEVPERGSYQDHDPRVVSLPPQQPYNVQVVEPQGARHSWERSRESSSSSESRPMTPLRQHRRNHSMSSSGTRHDDEMRRLRAERERLERANRNAREEQEARERGRREAEAERRRARHFAEREQRRIGHEGRQRIESADRARRRQEQEDRQRLLETQQEERDRFERVRNAGLTRRPRPGAVIHQRAREGIAERGDRVIREAVRDAEARHIGEDARPEPGRGWERRRDVGGGLRRRDTVAVGQRRVYEDDRRRGGRRWI